MLFFKVKRCLNCPEGYIINLLLEELLHSKKIAGDDTEDPYKHIEFFMKFVRHLSLIFFSKDEAKIILFGQTLSEKAHARYKDCPTTITNTWEILSLAFLSKFHPGRKSPGARSMIANFRNRTG